MQEIFTMPPAPPRALWALAGIAVSLLALVLLFGYFAVASRATRYEISAGGLAVRGTMYGRSLPWSSLAVEEAEVVDLRARRELQPTWRTNGLGLPGYQVGWFRLRRKGKGLIFVTDRSRVVAIPTRLGYTLLLSAKDPHRLLDALRRWRPSSSAT